MSGSGNILFRGIDTKPIEFNNGRGQANTYMGKTIVESGRLNLGSDYVLGQTSLLDVRNGATVDLMGKTQVIHGLDGTGTININNGTLNLSKTGDQAIENLFGPDTGILAVNLSGGKLSFAGNSDFGSSKLDLTNTILELSGRTETAMDTANVAANAQSKIVVNSHDKLGSLELNGGEIEFGSIVLGDESGSSKLDITGILSGSGTVTISRDDLSVSDKLNLLDADNSNLVQTVISAGQISGTPVLGTTIDDLENVSVQSGVAVTKWTLSDGLVKVDNDYGIGYQLTEIALKSDHTLNLAAGKDSELSANVTGSGSISFNGGDITVSNSSNNFSGNTTVKSGSVTLGNTGVLGQTNVLTLEEGTSLYINGFTQTVHALKGVGTVDFGTAQSGTLTVQYTDGESAHTVSNSFEGNAGTTVAFENAGALTIDWADGSSGGDFRGTVSLSGTSLDLQDGSSDNVTFVTGTELVLQSGGSAIFAGSQDDRIDLRGLALNSGASVSFVGIDLATGNSHVVETDQLTGTSGFNVDIDLSAGLASDSIFAADNGMRQQLINAGSVSYDLHGMSGAISNLEDRTAAIKNVGDADDKAPVAYGIWSGGWTIDASGLHVDADLTEVQLADASGSGLILDATGATDSVLSAKITDWNGVSGNLTVSGTQAVTIWNVDNDYTGQTNVLGEATLIVTGVLGKTKLLNNEGTVQIGTASDTADVWVGGLAGSGSLLINGSSKLTVETVDKALTVENELAFDSSGTFAVVGTGEDRLVLSFAKEVSGTGTFDFTNVDFAFSDTNKATVLDSDGLNLTNSLMTVAREDANDSSSSLNSLTATDSTLRFNGIELAADGSAQNPLLYVDQINVVDGNGDGKGLTLDINANLTDNSDLLSLDNAPFYQALIRYGSDLGEENLEGLITGSNAVSGGTTDYKQNGITRAFVTWGAGDVSVDTQTNTISSEYSMTGIELADSASGGLTLSATNPNPTDPRDLVLSAIVSDHGDIAGDINFVGNLSVGEGGASESGNTYTGRTTVKDGKLTLNKSHSLGYSRHVEVESDATLAFAGTSQTEEIGSINSYADGALSGTVNLTLGVNRAEYGDNFSSSSIGGANGDLHGSLTLASGHTLTINNVNGLGDMSVDGSVYTTPDGDENAKLILTSGSGTFDNSLTGKLDVDITSTTGGMNWSGSNSYTGSTTIRGAGVTLLNNGVLGTSGSHTSILAIDDGATFNLGTTTQYAGEINASGDGAVVGTGTLMLDRGGLIAGANSDFSGIVVVLDETLEINNAESLGTGQANLSGDAVLNIEGVSGTDGGYAVIDNVITGSGSVSVSSDSVVQLDVNNSFTGGIDIAGDLLATGNVGAHIGYGEVKIETDGKAVFAGSSGWTLKNKLTGTGELEVSAGGDEFAFGFGDTNAGDFTGSITLSQGSLTLSGNDTVNANTVAGADLTLGVNSILNVTTGYTGQDNHVNNHVNVLSAGATSQIVFNGLNPWDSNYNGMTVGQLNVTAGSTIVIDSLKTSSGGSITSDQVIIADNDGLLSTLIASSGISGAFVLGGAANGVVTHTVDVDSVAKATYEFSLSQDANRVNLNYQLTQVDVSGGQQLQLSGEAGDAEASSGNSTLSALVTGGGGLNIAGNAVRLSNKNNDYLGKTTVANGATLYAESGALGGTSLLDVLGTAWVDENAVDALNVEQTGVLHLTGKLTVDSDSTPSSIDGHVSGAGDLSLASDVALTVTTENSGYTGDIAIGNSGSITFSGDAAGLGSGAISFADGAVLDIQFVGDKTLTNTVTSTGNAGLINVSGNGTTSDFAFASGQAVGFNGTLSLQNVTYDFNTASNDKLDNAALTVGTGAQVVIAQGADSNKLDGLVLSGGLIDFGAATGHIQLGGGNMTVGANSEFQIDHEEIDVIENDDGSAAFGSGSSSIILVSDVGNAEALTQDDLGKITVKLDGNNTQFNRKIKQRDTNVAVLKGGLGDLGFVKEDLTIGLENTELELLAHDGSGYVISESGEISYLVTGSGDLTIDNAVKLSHANNTYTGDTYVTSGGTLTLSADNALGGSSASGYGDLNVSDSGHVIFVGTTTQTVDNLNVAGEGALSGSVALNVDFDGNESGAVSAANTGLSGSVKLTGAGTLTLGNEDALGSVAISVGEADQTTLRLSGFGTQAEHVFDNALTGSGTIEIVGSDVAVTGSNENLAATWNVADDSVLRVNAGNSDTVANHLGTGDIVLEGESVLNSASGWMLQNSLTGDGTLTVSAGGGTFAFGKENIGFTGTLILDDASLVLNPDASANEDTLNNAKLQLEKGAKLTIGTGLREVQLALPVGSGNGSALIFNGGEVVFAGTAGLGVGTDQLGRVDVNSLDVSGGGTISISSKVNDSMGSQNVSGILAADQVNIGQWLITVDPGKVVGDVDDLTLVVNGGSSEVATVKAEIKDDLLGTVATGTYGYALGLDNDGKGTDGLGLAFTLTQVDIIDDKTLRLNAIGASDTTLEAIVTGDETTKIEVTGGDVELTKKNSEFLGTTHISSGTLRVHAGALGGSKLVDVDNGTTLFNVGANTIGALSADGTVALNDSLTITGAGNSSVNGTFTGSGSLTLQSGTMEVNGNSSAYTGNIVLGTESSRATIELGASGSLGMGTISFKNASSELDVDVDGSKILSNKLSGTGIVTVSGDGVDDSFTFNNGQQSKDFAGSLRLTNVGYDFRTSGSDVLDNVALTVTGGNLTVNGTEDVVDRDIRGLSLENTLVDFGTIGAGSGAIDLHGNAFAVGGTSESTTIRLNSNFETVVDESGSAAFADGDSITLVRNANLIAGLENLKVDMNGSTEGAFTQTLRQDDEIVAQIEGSFSNLSTEEDGVYFDLNLNVKNETLRIHDGKTYEVSQNGTIGLVIADTDEGIPGGGNLQISGKGVEVTLTNSKNTFSGVASVVDGATLVLGAADVVAKAARLSVGAGSYAKFGSFDQHVNQILAGNSEGGSLVSASGQGNTLTVAAGGSVAGANDNFHLNWALNAGELQINNVMSLGTGSAEVSDGASIVITGAEGEFKNALTGAGDLRVTNGANVELAGSNALTGDLTVADTATVSASGDINSHIGKGYIALAGKAEFTLTEGTDVANWTWKRNLIGSGELTLAREGSNDQTLLFAESSLSGFTGTVALDDWTIELNSNADNGTLAEFAKWASGTLVLEDGANVLVTGAADLGDKNAKLDAGGILTINDFGVPGMDSNSYLEANALELSEGFVINLETGNETVDSSTILTQDDAEAMQTTVVKTDNEIVLANGKVTVNGSDAGDTIRFDISQTSGVEAESGNVAKGIYTYKIVASDSKTDLAVEYDLAGISLNSGKTLVLKGIAGDEYGNESGSQLNVYLTGEGNVRIAENTVRLNAKSDYEGATTVSSGATVYAVAGALGDTSKLTVEGTGSMHVDGSNAVRALAVNENGSLWIGNTDIEHPSDDITLTLKSDETAGSVIAGSLRGTGNLAVEGNGQVDAGYKPDLSITSSTGGFHGDLVLDKGAWVELATDTNTIFGSNDPSLSNDILVSEASRLTINSTSTETVSLFGVFRDGSNDVEDNDEHGGTVIMHLGAADSKFQFAREQEEMAVQEGKDLFTGTLQLTQGTIDFTDLYNGDEDDLQKTALHGTTLVLGDNANLVLGDNADAARELGGLTMAGGTIHAGAIGYTEGQGVSTSTINLNGGELSLSEGTDSTVIFDTSSDASKISDAGSEILRAGSLGSDVLLVKGIGQVNLDGKVLDKNDVIGSGYLNANLPADAEQLVKQDVSTESGEAAAEVADVKREFTNKFYYDQSEGTLSIAYTVSEIGLRHTTAGVNTSNYTNDLNWQGLTLTAINGDGDTNVDDPLAFGTLIRDGSSGVKGNIVFKGASGADSILLTRENSYAGKTWLTKDVHVVFGSDSGFGTTEALRVDTGSSVNFAGFNQTMGALFALGSDALKGAGNLTVNGVAVIEGANADLSADWTFNNEVTIKDAFALGKGSVALAGTTSKLTVNGVQGDIVNAITGGAGTSLVLTNGDNVNTNVNFTTKDILGGTAFTGSVDIASGTSAGFTLTSGTAIGNELDVAAGGTLRISSVNGGNLSFANTETNISGTLDITNVTLNAAANKDRFTNASLSAHTGAVFEVTEVIGKGVFKDLSFTDGSTIEFSNGTPGEYGDNAARIDLGDEGTLSFAETVNIELDLDDYVNASEVSEIQTGLQNKRLTAQDLTTKNESVLSNLISAGKVNGGLEDLNLEASGASGETLTIGIRNDDRDTEDVAEGTYGFKLNTNGGLNLAYGLTSVKIKDGKTLKLAGVGSGVSEDNILTAAVHGTGDLEITEGLIALTNGGTDAGKSTYSGQTIVDAHAQLVTGTAGGTLGETSKLDLKGYERQSEYDDGFGGRAHILGAETVGSLNVGENAVLNISDTDTTNGHLTIEGKAESTINGVLRGAGGLDVQGSTLTVTTSNTGFTGDVSVASGATIVINQLDSLGAKDTAGVIKLAEGGNLNVTSELEVDATSSASRTVGTISNAVTGDGTVVVNLTTSNDSEARFSFADSQTGGEQATEEDPGFTGTIRLENGGFTLAFVADDHTVSTANQRAAWNAEIQVDKGGSLYVSQRDHENARFVDKHIRALTLNGGNIYFGGLRYDMQSLENQLGGQLELDGKNGGTLSINDISTVNLDAGTTNSLSDNGSELLVADEGAQIDLIQNAKDVLVKGNSVVGMTDEDIKALNDNLKLNISNEDAWQTLSQKGIEVAEVLRTVGSSDGDAFGVEESSTAQGLYDLYLNYHVQEVRLINKEQGLLVSNTTGKDQTFSAKLTGDGDITFAGGSITIGDGDTDVTNDVANANTGRVFVRDGRVTAGKDTAFGDGSTLIVADGGSVDFGDFDQTLGVLEARGDDALIGGEGSVITITDDMIVTGENDEFHSELELKFSGEGLVTDVDGLGDGDISIGEDYTLILADEELSGTDKNLVENNIDGAGTVVVGNDGATGTIELGGKNSGLTGDVTVKDGWTLEASMGANESASDRIGNGTLILEGEGSNASFTQTESENGKGLVWDTDVSGSGNLKLTAKADESITISGGLDGFAEGTVTIGGGRLDLGTGNETNLGSADLVATGDNASINIKDVEGGVDYEGNITVGNDANIVFERPATPGTTGDASLRVDGSLDLEGALVTVTVDDSLSLGDPGTVDLNVQDVLSADRSSDLALVIAEADGGIGNLTGDALIKDQEGNVIDLKSKGIAINDSTGKVATGYYDYDLSVSEDGKQLGVAYQLTRVDIVEKLVLQGVTSSDTNNPDVQNAMRLSADLTGKGSFQLTGGLLTLEGDDNSYTGDTIVGNEDTRASTTLIVSEGSSLGDTDTVWVLQNATLTNRSEETDAKNIQIAQGGTFNLDGGVFTVSGGSTESVIAGSLTGDGALVLGDDIAMNVSAENASGYTGVVTVGDGATYNVVAATSDTVHVSNSFASAEGDEAEVGLKGNLFLGKSNVNFHGTFMLSGGSVLNANSIDALGADDAMIDVGDSGTGFVMLTYANEESVGQVEQGMTNSISFIKDGAGVVSLSDDAMGAGTVTAREGGILFGTAGQSTAYNTALNIEKDGWAAGFGGVSSLKVDLGGSFYVGGRSGYNSVLASTVAKAANEDPASTPSANSNTVEFVVNGDVTNAGTIYVGNKNADGSAPADSSSIGNELVITGDYNVTASDNGGIFDMNAIIAGEDSIADHVTIKGKINGEGYVDVNYDSSVSTGGTLEYLGLVKVEGGDDGDSLRLKDSIQIGDLYYRLMWSSKENEYYLQSSVTDPGDKPWDTEDVENVNAGTRSALAFMQAQAFDLSLRGHLGETLYVDPVTGEQRKSSFWMVQRGDWTKFSNASGQLDADGNLYTTHLGTDLFKRETDGATFRWGVLAGFADGDFDVSSNVDGKSSKGSFRGYSAGLYMTAESKAESGPFLGLQLRWNRFDSEVGQDDYDVNGLSLTAEASWDQLLSKGITDGGRNYEWRLEPHVRAYWTNFGDPDDWTSSLGETYSSDFDNGLLVRVGARTKIQTTLGTGPAWQAYAEANWVYNNGDYSTTMSTKYGDVTSTQNGAEFAEFRLGLEAQFTTNVNVWLEGHHQTGSDDYESTGAMFGFKYMW